MELKKEMRSHLRRRRQLFSHGRRGLFLCLILVLHSKGFSQSLFNYAEYTYATILTLPTEASEKEKAVSANTGLALSFKNAEARGYVTLPKTTFAELESASSFAGKAELLNDPRYGLGITLFKKRLPTLIKLGTNTYSRSISKLNNPSPSTLANPLVKTFSFSTGIGATLPTLTSSVQPFSSAVSITLPKKQFFLPMTAEVFFTEDVASAVSISAQQSFSSRSTVKSAVTVARFYIENNTAILKKNNAAFDADWFYSALAELSFQSPLLKANCYTGFQQSPYEANPIWIKIDARTYIKLLLLNFSYFSIINAKDSPKAAPLIGGSSTICRVSEQASVNPQILFLLDDRHASSVRFGFSALEQQKVTATNTPVLLTTLKLRAGAAYENHFFTTRFDWTHANILLDGEPPTKSSTPEEYHSFSLSSSYAGKHAKVSLSGSYARYPPLTETSALKEVYSADVKIGVPALKISAQAGVDVTLKDGERSAGEFDARITYTMKRKYFHTSLKVGLAMPF